MNCVSKIISDANIPLKDLSNILSPTEQRDLIEQRHKTKKSYASAYHTIEEMLHLNERACLIEIIRSGRLFSQK